EEGNSLGNGRFHGHAGPGADGNGSGYDHDDGRYRDDDGGLHDDGGHRYDDGRLHDGDDRQRRGDRRWPPDQRWSGHSSAGGRAACGFGHPDLRNPASQV
ncbi:MAG: hypothetical protein AVDCRST_MAG22-3064, partial [uncultured Rubrobacteraceae bacterium]